MTAVVFNTHDSTIMHIDINSCFATIEQQANPLLRAKPIAVAAYVSPNGCILAASVEAKQYGVKTGMRVKEGKVLCPSLIVLPTDAPKYRTVHLAFRKIISRYTNKYSPKSIDEFVLHFTGLPILQKLSMQKIACKIKQEIKEEIGEWIKVSAGIGPSRFMAKTAAGLKKPDGLEEINYQNFGEIYSTLKLTDLCGINIRNEARLNRVQIYNVIDFYEAPVWRLKAAFSSILGYLWYMRLRGWEMDDLDFARRSYGNSYSLPQPFSDPADLAPILSKLTDKMMYRMRKANLQARGIHLAIRFRNGTFWHRGVSFGEYFFDTRDVYKEAYKLLITCPVLLPVSNLAVSVFQLADDDFVQLNIFDDVVKKRILVNAVDKINKRWGEYCLTNARMVYTQKWVPDRIAFGIPT